MNGTHGSAKDTLRKHGLSLCTLVSLFDGQADHMVAQRSGQFEVMFCGCKRFDVPFVSLCMRIAYVIKHAGHQQAARSAALLDIAIGREASSFVHG